MPQRLTDKVAIVFGAGSSGQALGNGQAISVLFAREGARVFAVDLDMTAAEATMRLIADDHGTATAHQADVSDRGQVIRAVDGCVARYGRIDVLVNNVGITRLGGVAETRDDDWDLVLATNLTAPFATCKAVLPHMIQQGGGSIVNISTVASIRVPRAPLASYNASKAGLNQLTRTIAVQYARQGVRANAILPGLIDTPMVRGQLLDHYGDLERLRAEREAQSPTGKMGQPMDVAYGALFLASDEARYVNGVILPVDGGIAAMMA